MKLRSLLEHFASRLALRLLPEWVVDARVLLEGGVASAIRAGEVEVAERILREVAPLTNWPSDDIRLQWIRATLERGHPP